MGSKKIAIVGAGAVGGYTGAHMVQAGEDVTFIDPARHVATAQIGPARHARPHRAEFSVPRRALHARRPSARQGEAATSPSSAPSPTTRPGPR